MTTLNTASVLAFERKLDISDAVFYQLNSADQAARPTPVKIREKSVRGTISNRLKNALANDPAKLDAEIEKANLQTVDVAALDNDKDTLVVKWSCKVLPFSGKPSVCNNQDYQTRLLDVVGGYIQEIGFAELAQRYAVNIANGRWLWRNRLGSETINITVTCKLADSEVNLTFDAKAYNLNSFDSDDAINNLAELIEQGLKGEQFIILNVEAKAKVGYGQEVYPSQELNLDTGNRKSKELYKVNENNQAGVHSQKISNAIRTIDTWYAEEVHFPIAVEPYGAVTTLGTAFRQPRQNLDFYTLFDNWMLKDETPGTEQQHYVIAVLIRGGVFGASGKE